MGCRGRMRWAAPAVLLLVAAVLASVRGAMSKEPAKKEAAKTIFPPNRAVLLSGSFDLIVKASPGGLSVNGKPHQSEPFEPPLCVAHLHLSAGVNELKIGNHKLEIFIARYPGDEDAPTGWPSYKSHPIDELEGTKRCNDCHEHSKWDGQVIVGEWKGYKACLKCHEPVEFEAIHAHPLEPLEPCQMCHAMHGSQEKSLLRAPVKKLCAACHDS